MGRNTVGQSDRFFPKIRCRKIREYGVGLYRAIRCSAWIFIFLLVEKPFLFSQQIPKSLQEASEMVKIKGGTFLMGDTSSSDSRPVFQAKVKPFFVQKYEVTNAQFAEFIKATGYKTLAEEKGGSYVFTPKSKDTLDATLNPSWWEFTKGANWKHPEGTTSSIDGKEWYPVVHIAFEDACAYCEWLGMRLPTEVEREYFAQRNGRSIYMNTWQGNFPENNTQADGYFRTSPVGAFPPGKLGLYDVQGNVWEWCVDPYHQNAYYYASKMKPISTQPLVPKYYDLDAPEEETRVIRGGSFLCNESYCCGYLPSKRMRSSVKMTYEHIGFRCVK